MDIAAKCLICGNTYRKKNGKSKYCEDCRKTAKRERQANWIVKNPDYFKNYYQNHK